MMAAKLSLLEVTSWDHINAPCHYVKQRLWILTHHIGDAAEGKTRERRHLNDTLDLLLRINP